MFEKESRTKFIAFRITEKSKKWLDEIVEDSIFDSHSNYLNDIIRLMKGFLILDYAMSASKLFVGNELGFTEDMSKNMHGPENIKALKKIEQLEKDLAIKLWLDEFKQNVKGNAANICSQNTIDYLSTEEGNMILEFFYYNHSMIKMLFSLFNEKDAPLKEQKKEVHNDNSFQ
jgi:hypothetical protein